MSYYCNQDQCVCSVVREIVDAQDEVSNDGDCCSTGCDQSIRDLLSPARGKDNDYNTIPFALYCKGSCGPFVGSGVYQTPGSGNANGYFGCVESPIFRAKEFLNDGSCCVKLELLLPATAGGPAPTQQGDCANSICSFFPGTTVTGFQATGICLTVDLNNFHSISCLDAIRPLPASDFRGQHNHHHKPDHKPNR